MKIIGEKNGLFLIISKFNELSETKLNLQFKEFQNFL